MKAIKLEPGANPQVIEIPNGATQLKALQNIVGGYIECALRLMQPPGHGELVLYCNEEGKLDRLPFNCFRPTDGDELVGTLVLVATDDDGEARDLTAKEVEAGTKFLFTLVASRSASLDEAQS